MPGKCLPKHKFFRMTAVLLTAVLCAGCLGACNSAPPSGEFSSPVKSGNFEPAKSGGPGNTAMVVPEHLTVQLEENLIIDADISFDATAPYRTYRAETLGFDIEAISAIIEDSVTDESEFLDENDEYSAYIYNAMTASDGMIGISQSAKYSSLYYQSGWADDIYQLVGLSIFNKETINNWANYDIRSQLPRGIDFSFASRDEALANVTAALRSLGIETAGDAEIYCLTAETLQALADDYEGLPKPGADNTVKTTWSGDDECYYMLLRCECDGIPVNIHRMTGGGILVLGTTIAACCNKDGIQYLAVNQPYSILDVSEESGSVISIEQLQKAIQEKYSMMILTNPVTITAIEFCYRAVLQSDNEYVLEPTWLVEVEQSIPTSGTIVYSYVGFDAVTGKEQ